MYLLWRFVLRCDSKEDPISKEKILKKKILKKLQRKQLGFPFYHGSSVISPRKKASTLQFYNSQHVWIVTPFQKHVIKMTRKVE